MRRFSAGLLVLLVALPGAVHAATYSVAPDGSGDFSTIQAAVNAAADGDEILLEDGTFTGQGNTHVFFQGKAVTIRSRSGNRSACIVDCEDLTYGFTFSQGEGSLSVLADLTVTRSPNLQPAVQILSGSPTIRNVAVVDAGSSAIYAEFGSPLLTGCLLESSTAGTTTTRGIHLLASDVTVEDCEIRSNTFSYGLIAYGGTTTIRRCTLSDNVATAVALDPGNGSTGPSATIEDCTFEDNLRAIVMTGQTGSSLTLRDCEILGQQDDAVTLSGTLTATVDDCEIRDSAGLGLWATGAGVEVTLERCTVDGNQGGVRLGKYGGSGPAATMRDCTVTGNGVYGVRAEGLTLLEDSRIQGNAAAGILVSGSTGTTVRRCLVTGNAGAGIYMTTSQSLAVEDCTLASNHTSFSGGAIKVYGGNVDVTRSILWGNCSDADGWEVWLTQGATVQLTCTNVDSSLLGVFVSGSYTLLDLVEQDPLLCAPEACGMAPTTGGVYGVAPDSPVLSQSCGVIGAPQPLCTAVGVGASLQEASWGRVKAGYRK